MVQLLAGARDSSTLQSICVSCRHCIIAEFLFLLPVVFVCSSSNETKVMLGNRSYASKVQSKWKRGYTENVLQRMLWKREERKYCVYHCCQCPGIPELFNHAFMVTKFLSDVLKQTFILRQEITTLAWIDYCAWMYAVVYHWKLIICFNIVLEYCNLSYMVDWILQWQFEGNFCSESRQC